MEFLGIGECISVPTHHCCVEERVHHEVGARCLLTQHGKNFLNGECDLLRLTRNFDVAVSTVLSVFRDEDLCACFLVQLLKCIAILANKQTCQVVGDRHDLLWTLVRILLADVSKAALISLVLIHDLFD